MAASTAANVIGGVVAVTVLVVLPAIWVARLARRKGRSFWMWLTFALIFPWVWFLIALLVLRPLPDAEAPAPDTGFRVEGLPPA